jgi:MFS family permease
MSSASVRAVPSLTHYASLVSDDEDWTPADEARLARSYASPSPSFASIVVGSPNVLGAGVGSYGASSRAMAAATAVPVVPRTMSISVASYAHANGNGNGIGGGSAIVHPLRDTDIDAASVAAALPSAPTAAPSAPLPSMRRALWTLLLCTATYLVNMAQRYSIGVVAKPLERRLHFGDGEGSGMAYQLLAGPVFNLLFTSMGVMLAAGARDWSRTRLLTAALLIGCAASAGMGASQSYAELAVSRAAQGLSQAGVSSFCASLLSAAFPPRLRGRALSIFNFGVYAGYGAAFGAGNWLAHVEGPPDQHPDGYRLMFYVFAGPSLLCAVLMALTVQDPVWEGKRKARAERARVEQGRIANGADDLPQRITLAEPLLLAQEDSSSSSNGGGAPAPAPATGATGGAAAAAPPAVPSLRAVFWMLVSSPPLIVLCLASSLRNGAGVTCQPTTTNLHASRSAAAMIMRVCGSSGTRAQRCVCFFFLVCASLLWRQQGATTLNNGSSPLPAGPSLPRTSAHG